MPIGWHALVVAAMTAVLALGAWASAAWAAPGNDDITAATAISSLPYTDTVDTTDATTAADEPDCGGSYNTVWYTYTPAADTRLVASTTGDFDTSLGVYSGSPGNLAQVACNIELGRWAVVVFDAHAGVTYYFQAGAFGGDPPGVLQFQLAVASPPQVALNRYGTVHRDGTATVRGTISCGQPVWWGSVYVRLVQLFAHRVNIIGEARNFLDCFPPSSSPWSLVVVPSNGRFSGGRAQAQLNFDYCPQQGDCGTVSKTRAIWLSAR